MIRHFAIALSATLLGSCAAMPGGERGVPDTPAYLTVSTPPAARDPSDQQVLFWNADQRSDRFRQMEEWFPGLEIAAARSPRALPNGKPLPAALQSQLRSFMADSGAAGFIVLQDGQVRFEDYEDGFSANERWTSFSVAKSFTSTLLGASLRDGKIADLDDSVVTYIPELAGSAYQDVTVRQLATMTSGVAWNESYTDPDSDVARMSRYVTQFGGGAIVEQMKGLRREAPPGTKWVYKTGETNLLGLLVERATSRSLADYAKDKIVDPAGFAGGLFWMTYPDGTNIGGCCLSLRLSDYARMGQFVLEGGEGTVPDGWFAQAGAPQVSLGDGFGYGYQWWTYPDGNFGAQGIFGQAFTVLPVQNMVVATVGNWPSATSDTLRSRYRDLLTAIGQTATD